jgi:hypothetical protein
MAQAVSGGFANNDAVILPVEQNIPLGGHREAERGIKGLKIIPLVRRKIDLFKLKDRVIVAVRVEVVDFH